MMTIYRYFFSAIMLLISLPALSQATNTAISTKPSVQQAAQVHDGSASKPRDGNEVFAANCSRCHSAPESFSPRISGTIIRHMRVRANLSKEDEQALLRFLNP